MSYHPILFIVGARPNFVKIAPICTILRHRADIPFKIVHTGQHYDQAMSAIFFQELNIPAPDFQLHTGSGGHGQQTGVMMEKLESLCLAHPFSAIVVIGDVNSTLAGALVGAKLNIPVVHIESGLRSFNRAMPEEINRIATDHVSDLLFAPTRLAMENLDREGLGRRSFFSGDVMYDMILEGLKLAEKHFGVLHQLGLKPGNYYLATLHRPYNVDEPERLAAIFAGLSRLEAKVLLSAHPRLKKNLEKFGIEANGNILLTEPFGYLDFIVLEKNARKIITDSGGIQKEAFFLEVPCVTLRPETEWVETLETRANILVKKRTEEAIVEAVKLDLSPSYQEKPYGDGSASQLIVEKILSEYF